MRSDPSTYDYTDEEGNILYKKVRRQPKSFTWRGPNGNGGWTNGIEGIGRVPYRLHHLDTSDPVYLVEGEKDADTLAGKGFTATTAGGANAWTDEHSKCLSGNEVVILYDNDEAGRLDALRKARSLLDIASSVKIVDLPGVEPGADITDWLASGNTPDELQKLVASSENFDASKLKQLEKKWAPQKEIGRTRILRELGPPYLGRLVNRATARASRRED